MDQWMKKNGGPNLKFYEATEIIAQFDSVRTWLTKNFKKYVQADQPTNKILSTLVVQLWQFQEDHFGETATKKAITRIPTKFFLDFKTGGGLCQILGAVYKFKSDQGWRRFDLQAPNKVDRIIEMFLTIETALCTSKCWIQPHIYFTQSCQDKDKGSMPKYKEIAKRHKGTVVEDEDSATHIIYPSCDPQDEEVARPVMKKDRNVLLHWYYLPDNRDSWIAANFSSIDKEPPEDMYFSPKEHVWRITANWLTDTDQYNEWMNEEDYEVDEQGKKKAHELRISAEDLDDLASQETPVSTPGDRASAKAGKKAGRDKRRRSPSPAHPINQSGKKVYHIPKRGDKEMAKFYKGIQDTHKRKSMVERKYENMRQEANTNNDSDQSMGDDFITLKPASYSKRRKIITPKYVASSGSDAESLFEEKREVDFAEYRCKECSYKSKKRWLVARHCKSHKKVKTKRILKCDHCAYTAENKWNMKRHIENHTSKSNFTLKCPQQSCQWMARTLDLLDKHLRITHGRIMEVETFHLKDEEDFTRWLAQVQEKEFAKYIWKGRKNIKTQVYYCNRSSQFQQSSKGTGKRNCKKLGSIKGEHICTSRVRVEKTDSDLRITYCKTHSGHANDPGKMGLTSPLKRSAANMLAIGVPKMKVLEKIREESAEGVNRAGLSNMQDIYNISKKFHLESKVQLDKNDATSLDIAIKKMQNDGDNGVFLYKPQGMLLEEYPELTESDFVLAYMNESQQYMLETYGRNIICFDGTHGTNAYGIELSTVMVIDDQQQGYPAVFYYHTGKGEHIYNLLFKKLKQLVGPIECRIFMSDDEINLYNSWLIMGSVEKKLLCIWHVKRNWNKHLTGIEATLRNDAFSKLIALSQAADTVTFEEGLKAFQRFLLLHPALHKFSEYFEQFYVKRAREWAYCYRMGAGINTNMALENMHGDIKRNFFDGKHIHRMDESFARLKMYLTAKQSSRVTSLYRGKITTKDRILRERHNTSLGLSTSLITQSGDHWLVQSSSNQFEVYTIEKGIKNCMMCLSICPQCRICFHTYTCTCLDYSIKTNLCKHVHLLIRHLGEATTVESSATAETESLLVIDTDERQERHTEEIRAHMADLSRAKTKVDMKQGRELVLDYMNRALELVTNEESMAVITEGAKSLFAKMQRFQDNQGQLSMPQPIAKVGPNKNLEHQARFLLKKKPKSVQPNAKSHAEILADLILPGKIIPFFEVEEGANVQGALDEGNIDGDDELPESNSAIPDTNQERVLCMDVSTEPEQP